MLTITQRVAPICWGLTYRQTATAASPITVTIKQHDRVTGPQDDYHLLSREQQVVLVRHNRLNSHRHRTLKRASSPTCFCGQEDQTTAHVLQRCPLYKVTREDVRPVRTPLTTKLYGCKQELEKTTLFISRAALIV